MQPQKFRIGEYLIKIGAISEFQLEIALSEQAQTHEKLGEILVRMDFISHNVLNAALAATNPQALIGKETGYTLDLPRELLKKYQTVVLGDTGSILYIATLHSPPSEALQAIQQKLHGVRKVELSATDYESLLVSLHDYEIDRRKTERKVDISSANAVIDHVIAEAMTSGASDIHIETTAKTVHVRYRIDGVLYLRDHLPLTIANKLFSRIKDLSGMDVSEKRLPQDGSFSKIYRGRNIDFRVATLPSAYGEKVTIRVLNKASVFLSLTKLGLTYEKDWIDISKLDTGLILVCGATGSGKTTTLYSTIREIDLFSKSVYMIEDPIEYRIPFVTQVQVQRRVGFDFAGFTRTVLRHDPDIVVVGEIRDKETAEVACRLAETGHLVYATLHTNDIQSSILRLHELDVPKTDLAYILRGILVQKLVRTVCPVCHNHPEKREVCTNCLKIGYKGRTLVSEFARLRQPADLMSILDGTLQYPKMLDDAKLKLKNKITDSAEIHRITGHHFSEENL